MVDSYPDGLLGGMTNAQIVQIVGGETGAEGQRGYLLSVRAEMPRDLESLNRCGCVK
jgi:hypothetical protein